MNNEELTKRIEALERENRALRELQPKEKVIIVTEGSYQGHPTISFEASGRPFTIGLRKAAILAHCHDVVRNFVRNHNAELRNHEVILKGEIKSDDGRESDLQI
jgi:hypothetical protein